MKLNSMIDRKDIIRTMLLASSLMLITGTLYAVFLHGEYTSQVNSIRLDLLTIKNWFNARADKIHGQDSINAKNIATTAEKLSNKIAGPNMNPYAYAYLNYWIISAAFTNLYVSYSELGLTNDTINAINTLESGGWFNNPKFKIFDPYIGDYVQKLPSKPNLNPHFWTYYLFVILIVGISTWFGMKSKNYEIDVIPEIISATLSLIPFWVVFLFGTLIAVLIGSLSSGSVQMGAYIVSLLITITLSALSGAVVGAIKKRRNRL